MKKPEGDKIQRIMFLSEVFPNRFVNVYNIRKSAAPLLRVRDAGFELTEIVMGNANIK